MFDPIQFDPLTELAKAIDKIAAYEGVLDPAEFARQAERLDCQRLLSLRRFERSGRWRADGSLSSAAWLRAHAGMTGGAATQSVRLARKLEELPKTTEAFAAGAITQAHVRVMADACTPERAEQVRGCEDALMTIARGHDAREFRNLVRRHTDALDGDGGSAAANVQHERRSFHVSELLDGMRRVDGLLDAEVGTRLEQLLDACMDPPAPGETRTAGQRRADAVADLLDAAAATLARGSGSAYRPDLSVTVDLSRLEERTGPDLAHLVRTDATRRAGLASETLRRMACDARISRVMTDGPSEVLDVGRTTRAVPPALRRALDVRDRGCVHPACDRPAAWCDAHHIVHWADGGTTTLDNLELRCRRHHRAAHEGARSP